MIGLRSPRVRAVLVSIAVVFTPLGIARALYPLVEIDQATLLALPIAIVLGSWLGWRVVRPLAKLEAQVSDKSDARADLDLDRDDEYAHLTAAMNALLARLDARQKAHEAFVADLVHALKSPIAAARVVAETLVEGDPRAVRLGSALELSVDKLDAISRALLELARAEAGLPGEARAPVDLGALARSVVTSAQADGRWPQIAISVDAPTDVTVDVVADRVRVAIEQLVDNARSFGLRSVTVAVEPGARVIVDNDGPPVAPEERALIFQRFYTTRSREGGTGLGLALVRAVAEAHGGKAFVESGARFVLSLPQA